LTYLHAHFVKSLNLQKIITIINKEPESHLAHMQQFVDPKQRRRGRGMKRPPREN
jgi:hypothetical protein